jgi:hypothetical protein
MIESKLTCQKWHFGQARHGGKIPYGGVFWLKFLVKKTMISCSEFTNVKPTLIK